jgi:uncharacterized LabA/DUF88 family protein
MKRYHVAVDVQNLWYACRYAHGPHYRVDYRSLIDFIEGIVEEEGCQIDMTAYLIASPNHDQTSFISTLKMLDFSVKKRNLHYNADKKHAQNTNWDVGITADAFYNSDDYDCFILVSGDGDFSYLVTPIMDLGKEVIVVSFEQALSGILANSVDRVYYLGNDIVYDPKARYEERQRHGADT